MNFQQLDALDKEDELAFLNARFHLPPDKTYLDGHSLGAMPRGIATRINRLLEKEWGDDLISAWNLHDWIGLPQRVGDRIGSLLGAAAGQVICTDNTSVNLFKLLAFALSLKQGRTVILSQQDNFPTDLYMADGLSSLLGTNRCGLTKAPACDLFQLLDETVAVLMLTHVNFRDGRLHDIEALTRRAHERGSLVLWDLSHSAGVIPLELDAWDVDMAVGCGYKYLNGGPGAPSYLYLARRHHGKSIQPLQGWMGHANPFDFSPDYSPANDILSFLTGTPGILGMTGLAAALDAFDGVSVRDLRKKSQLLTQIFIEILMEFELPGIRLLSPIEPELRGSHVSVSHESGSAIAQALIDNNVIVDFRAPDIIRFGFSPLYNSFSDAGIAAHTLANVLNQELFREPRFSIKQRVT